MTTKSRLSSRPPRSEPIAAVLPALSWLTDELLQTDSPNERAILAHEAGVIEEEYGDGAKAVELFRTAIEADAEFGEPLERLIAFVERTHDRTELRRLLERLGDIASSAEERARASVERAMSEWLEAGDLPGARDLLLEATEALPADATGWVLLELVAERLGDTSLRERALTNRIILTEHPAWRGLLELDLARLRFEDGRGAEAQESLEQLAREDGPVTYGAFLLLERIAHNLDRPESKLRALEGQVTCLERAYEDEKRGDALGVFKEHRGRERLAEAHLRTSLAHEAVGDAPGRQRSLARATSLLPDDLFLLHVALTEARDRGDAEQLIELLGKLAELEGGPSAAAYHHEIALTELGRQRPAAARAAVERGLASDPGSLPLTLLLLELLTADSDTEALAAALRKLCSDDSHPESQTRIWLTVAFVLARGKQPEAARLSLLTARGKSADTELLSRVGRLLSLCLFDTELELAQTRELLSLDPENPEHTALWLELLRLQLLRPKADEISATLTDLGRTPDGARLAPLLALLLTPALATRCSLDDAETHEFNPAAARATPSARVEQFQSLAERAPEPEVVRTYSLLAALEELHAQNLTACRERLAELHLAYPGDLTLGAARIALGFETRAEDDLLEAFELTARHLPDSGLRTELLLEGALVALLADRAVDARRLLDLSAGGEPLTVNTIQRWMLRRLAHGDLSLLGEVIESRRGFASDERLDLERRCLALLTDPTLAHFALAATPPGDLDSSLSLAALLLQVLCLDEADFDRDAALARLPSLRPAFAALDYQQKLLESANTDNAERLRSAERWAKLDPSSGAQLEWMAAARASRDLDGEIAAREALGRSLGGETGALFVISATLLRALSQNAPPPLFPNVHEAATLANLEVSPPGCDPRRRAQVLTDLDSLPGPGFESTLGTMVGFNWLVAGEFALAIASFRKVLAADPKERVAWEGLELCAEAKDDPKLLAESLSALGDLLEDPVEGSACWERAAELFRERLADEDACDHALTRSVTRDMRRSSAFVALFRRVRERKDPAALLELIDRRLPFADDPNELVLLNWERARALRTLGDREGALAALVAVTARSPNHIGALALTGEINIGLGQFRAAAEALAKLSASDEAPAKQRLMSGVAAADLFETKLDDLESALEVLLRLHEGGHGNLSVRERLARTASQTGRWELATELLELLMKERPTSEGREEAARLSLLIHRDRRSNPAMAKDATLCLLEENPGSPEGIDLVLSGCFESAESARLLERVRPALLERVSEQPFEQENLERLSRLAKRLGDLSLRQACLGALVALGYGSRAEEGELVELDQVIAQVPTITLDESTTQKVVDPDDQGPLTQLFRELGPVFAEALGPSLSSLGAHRKQRIEPRQGLRIRTELAAFAGALGIGDFDLYQVDVLPRPVMGVMGERFSLVIDGSVTCPLSPAHRMAVATEFFALLRGTNLLLNRELSELCALVVACCRLGGHALRSPPYALIDEFSRLVSSALPRRLKPQLTTLAGAIAEANLAPEDWIGAARGTLDRLAVIACGDVSQVLAPVTGQRGRRPATREAEQRASRVLSFLMSPSYFELRHKLGLLAR